VAEETAIVVDSERMFPIHLASGMCYNNYSPEFEKQEPEKKKKKKRKHLEQDEPMSVDQEGQF